MTPVIPCAANTVSLISGTAFRTDKNVCLARSRLLGKSAKQTLSTRKFLPPLSASVRLFPHSIRNGQLFRNSRMHIVSAIGTDVAVEETEAEAPSASQDASSESSDGPSGESPAKPNGPAAVQSRRTRPGRKSEMPPVKDEELIPGATFTGKVRSVQPFGAFVDFGAFTDGLVHVSQLSDSYVKDVASFVTVGQEVKVRLVEANSETGRISLTMRENDDSSNSQQRQDGPANADRSRPPRQNNTPRPNQRKEKTTKLVKGQDLVGTVKNLARSGAFITLPDDEEGFLPQSEEASDGFENMMGGTSLQIGQEVNVRVLRIARGQVTLTMKKEEDNAEIDSQLSQGVIHMATNPFVVAFRKNKDIAEYIEKKEKQKEKETMKEVEVPNQSESEVPNTARAAVVDEDKASLGTTDGTLQNAEDEVPVVDEGVADETPAPETLSVEDSIQNEVKDTTVDDEVTTEAPALETAAREVVESVPEEVLNPSSDGVSVPEDGAVNGL